MLPIAAVPDETDPPFRRAIGEMGDVDVAAETDTPRNDSARSAPSLPRMAWLKRQLRRVCAATSAVMRS